MLSASAERYPAKRIATQILLIEDDPRYRELLRAMLEGSGYAVRSAGDGEEGIESFRYRRPDLVITDMIMPHCDGIETIGVLREIDSTVPIIAISGGSDNVLMMARSIGAVAALGKPFDDSTLLGAISEAIGR